jgi:hypothetical protein
MSLDFGVPQSIQFKPLRVMLRRLFGLGNKFSTGFLRAIMEMDSVSMAAAGVVQAKYRAS